MSFSETDLLKIIDQLYEAAMDPALLDAAFQSLAGAIGGAGIAVISPTTGEALFNTSSLHEAALAYPEWAALNSRARSASKLGRTGLTTMRDLLSPSEVAHDPFHQDYLRSYGLFDFAAFVCAPNPGAAAAISVERASDHGSFEPAQLNFLEKIGPHASRALALSMRLRVKDHRPDSDLNALLHRLDGGAIIVTRNGDVATLNDSARGLLGDGLFIQQRRLCASSHSHQSQLDQLLNAAFNETIENIGSLALRRPSGKRPLLLQALPLAAGHLPGLISKKPASALVLIFDLEKTRAPAHSTALQALGLTPAEISVATHVGAGLTPREASSQLRITVLTVRTHLKSIYQKLDLRSQGDLVQLVTKLRMVK